MLSLGARAVVVADLNEDKLIEFDPDKDQALSRWGVNVTVDLKLRSILILL